MTTMNYLDNNIYNFRFKLLYHCYEVVFYGHDIDNLFDYAKQRYNISQDEFIKNNIDYLMKCGYLAENLLSVGITPKGIKFVEAITDGDIDFDSEDINKEKLCHIRRLFREQDSFNND